ncbi:stalk domain-containing protein [Alkalicoccus urumqiensis]|uniref:Serine protease n=1 Tax=Alkalicoccus urumqiensis TaxID=1548213 RepID=A0A2P6ML34_ALKUR|nr:stalk domain-containing protein [Alkalicoccus urumqiensis]PRO66997.1 hypothetical protein C6I21_00055 [Alkalicoccus urumqiensis]
MWSRWMKAGVLTAVLTAGIAQPLQAASPYEYYFNGEADHTVGDMLYMENNRLLVPLRAIFEDLGAEVTWVQETKEIMAVRGEDHVHMNVTADYAFINDEEYQLDQTPEVKEGRTYVPLRFVSEALGAEVRWDGEAGSVYVNNGPETEREVTQPEGENILSEQDLQLLDWMPAMPGESVDETLVSSEQLDSQYPFDWHVFTQENSSFYMIGHDDAEVEAVFAAATAENGGDGLTKADVRSALGTPERWIVKDDLYYNYAGDDTWDLFESNGYYITVFYDLWQQDRVGGVQVMKQETEDASPGFYGMVENEASLSESYERQLFLLTNMEREMNGLEPLTWNEEASVPAQEHSDDMAANDYFAHDNLNGESPFDRMRNHDILMKHAGENLARRQISPVHAHFNLLDSAGHRENMLDEKFETNGIGVSFDGSEPYFTQKFVTGYDLSE